MTKDNQAELNIKAAPPEKTEVINWEKILRPKKTIQIAVSGAVLVTELERRIIDTPDFQRLRRVRQLGTAYLVYPTALHTRFDHSVGTLHVAQTMVAAIKGNSHSTNEERAVPGADEVLIRLYALLHDVPHIPFGHSLEDELGLFERHDKNPERINRFLGHESEIGTVIVSYLDSVGCSGKSFLDRLLAIYQWDEKGNADSIPKEDVYIYDVVSNTVCADLLDYLQRDDYFCNLGINLEYHFLKYLHAPTDPETGMRRVVVRLSKAQDEPRRDILSDLSRLLEARYLLAERVYFHHAKLITAAMLGRSLQEAGDLGEIEEQDFYRLSDDALLDRLSESKSEVAARLANGLIVRKLFKRAHRIDQHHFEAAQHGDQTKDAIEVAMAKVGDNPKTRQDYENEWADMIGTQRGNVLIYAPSRAMNRKPAQMRVLWEGKFRPLSEVRDPVIQPKLEATVRAHEYLWAIHILVDPSVPEAKREVLREIAEIELACASGRVSSRTKQLYRTLVGAEAAKLGNTRLVPQAYEQKVNAVVDELVLQHHSLKSWRERLTAAIKKEFVS